jgi:hypothetical protein
MNRVKTTMAAIVIPRRNGFIPRVASCMAAEGMMQRVRSVVEEG